jgi:TldD protein
MADIEALLTAALDRASRRGASYSEARYHSDVGAGVMMQNGVPQVASSVDRTGIGLRVILDGSMGFGATNNLTKASVLNLVDDTVARAKASLKVVTEPIRMSDDGLGKDKMEIKPRIKFSNVEFDQVIEFLKDADSTVVQAAKQKGVDVVSRMFEIGTMVTHKRVVTSDGGDVESIVPRSSMFYLLVAMHPQRGSAQRFSERGESRGWEAVESWDIMNTMKEEGDVIGRMIVEGVPPPNDQVDLLVGGEVVGLVCHESSGHPQEADRIMGREAAQAGESYLSMSSLGMEVGSPVVNVVEDPTLPKSYGFYLYDEECVKARKRYLIKEGKINEFLQNRETAAASGGSSNAAARAVSYDREPIVRMANTYMEPGDHCFDELIGDIKHGVYIKNFTEWNIDDRRFNEKYVGHEAYQIENGEIGAPVRNPAIEITTIGFFKAVDAVGKDLKFWSATCGKGDPMQGAPVWTGGPTTRLRNVRLGGVSA